MTDWVRQAQVFGVFSAGYLARPIGGLIMAHFGDTRGRKGVFMLSVLLMAIPTLLIGLLPTYESIGSAAPLLLLLLRVLQGVAIGGEAPGAGRRLPRLGFCRGACATRASWLCDRFAYLRIELRHSSWLIDEHLPESRLQLGSNRCRRLENSVFGRWYFGILRNVATKVARGNPGV